MKARTMGGKFARVITSAVDPATTKQNDNEASAVMTPNARVMWIIRNIFKYVVKKCKINITFI